MDIVKRLKENIMGEVRVGELLSKHTSWGIGGQAEFFVFPLCQEDIVAIAQIVEEEKLPLTVMGSGTNLLVKDDGVSGLVVNLSRFENENVKILNEITLQAGAGMKLSYLSSVAARKNLTGLEFASGIPGTVGGAVIMNAGSFGGEMKDVLVNVTLINKGGEISTLPLKDLGLGYRISRLPEGSIVLKATVGLKVGGGYKEIQRNIDLIRQKRKELQPLTYRTSGSVFKNPLNSNAGELIEKAGFKGIRVGGAEVSRKHANFIIAHKGARASDILELIEMIREKVKKESGVLLELEIKIIGR